jgi:hypothetical protein
MSPSARQLQRRFRARQQLVLLALESKPLVGSLSQWLQLVT